MIFFVITFCIGISIILISKNIHIRKPINSTSDYQNIDTEAESEIENIQLYKNVVEFSSVKLRECIIPRTELVAIQIEESIEILEQKFIQSGYSKVLVYSESIDNIIGYVHVSDVFKKPETVAEIIRPIQFVPETLNAKKLLQDLISSKQSIAVVVDEFGGTSGIVTIEDIIEEIFGEISDEFDKDTLEERELPNNEYILSARHEIDYIIEKYNLEIPVSDEYETLAGLFLFYYQKFPHVNSRITVNSIQITVQKISGTRIELLHLKKILEIE